MRATTHIVLASVCALAVTGRALAGCPVADAKIEKAIATKPEFRDAANAQVVRDLRTLRDAALVLDAYEHEVACKRVVAVLNTLASNPERALGAGNTDEGKAEEIEKARKPKLAKP
jgi:hypothetical protein